MRPAFATLALLVLASCAHPAPKSAPDTPTFTLHVPDDGPVVNRPTPNADLIVIPASIDDDVLVCAESFPLVDRQCMTVHELRTFLFGRVKAE